MVGKTKRRERAYRKAQAMKRKADEEENMNFKETIGGHNYYFYAKQSKGGWIVTVTTDVKLEVGGLREVTQDEFNRMSAEAISNLRAGLFTSATAKLTLLKFFVRQNIEPRWGVDIGDMVHLEEVTKEVIELIPDIVKLRKLLGSDFIS